MSFETLPNWPEVFESSELEPHTRQSVWKIWEAGYNRGHAKGRAEAEAEIAALKAAQCHPAACRDEKVWREEIAKVEAERDRLRKALQGKCLEWRSHAHQGRYHCEECRMLMIENATEFQALLSVPVSGQPTELNPRTFTETAEHFQKVTTPIPVFPIDEPDVD